MIDIAEVLFGYIATAAVIFVGLAFAIVLLGLIAFLASAGPGVGGKGDDTKPPPPPPKDRG